MQGRHPTSRVGLLPICALALVLRIIWALLVPIHPISDPSVYDMLAQRLAAGQGYSWPNGSPSAYWPVGTSALYSLIYGLFGRHLGVVAVVNALLGTLLVLATYALARTGFERRIALLAAFLTAIWPTWIAFTSILSSEMPTTLFFVAGVTCALSRRGPSLARAALSSALLVGSAYFRGNMLPFIILVPLLVAIRDRRPMQFVVQGAVALVVAAALITPWAIRNQHAFGTLVPISTNVGVNMWIGNNPQADGGFAPPPSIGEPLPKNEVAQDRLYQQHAKAYIAANPGRYVQLCVRRLIMALDRETYGVGWNDAGLPAAAKAPLKLVMSAYWYVVFVAALVGLALFVLRQPWNILSPFVVLPAAVLGAPVLVMSAERFHYPMAPFVALFAAYAVLSRRGAAAGRGVILAQGQAI